MRPAYLRPALEWRDVIVSSRWGQRCSGGFRREETEGQLSHTCSRNWMNVHSMQYNTRGCKSEKCYSHTKESVLYLDGLPFIFAAVQRSVNVLFVCVAWQSPEIISVITAYLYSKSNIYVRLHLLNKVWQIRGGWLCEFCFHYGFLPSSLFHFSFSFILPKTSSILHYYWLQIGPVSGFSFSPISISQLLLWTHPLLWPPPQTLFVTQKDPKIRPHKVYWKQQ